MLNMTFNVSAYAIYYYSMDPNIIYNLFINISLHYYIKIEYYYLNIEYI